MDMSDDNGGTHRAERDSYSFLSDIERKVVERMSSTVVSDAIMAMLPGLDRDALHSAIAKFIQHELDEGKRKLTLLQEQGSRQVDC